MIGKTFKGGRGEARKTLQINYDEAFKTVNRFFNCFFIFKSQEIESMQGNYLDCFKALMIIYIRFYSRINIQYIRIIFNSSCLNI